jgi:hypothetical protein
MRHATHGTQWYLGKSGELLGLALGFDFCVEHEEGVARLRQVFGVSLGVPDGA